MLNVARGLVQCYSAPLGARSRPSTRAGCAYSPGLIDIHAHVYTETGGRRSYAGDLSIPPDGFTYLAGVTMVADAGSSGWRNFEDFKDRIIDRARTRGGELDSETGGPSKAMIEGRKRGIVFDVGHGGRSFLWRVAVRRKFNMKSLGIYRPGRLPMLPSCAWRRAHSGLWM